MNSKRIGVIIKIAVIAVLGGVGYQFREDIRQMLPFFQEGSTQDKVYVEKVSSIMNQYTGPSNRYNGTVESQDSYEVKVDASRTVGEVKVEVGDTVEEGQTLLTYDTSDLKLQIEQINLEIESINNDIENYAKQKERLLLEREQAAESEKFSYTTELQNVENSIAQRQFDLESKQLEISKYQKQISNSAVTSKVGGVVKEINENGMDANGNAAPFMTILQTGDYRIKGSIDEQNIWTLSEGQAVLIRSRVDETKTWDGTISLIDTENPQQNSNYYDGEETVAASKYPFYIELLKADGLILGQHVYIELDNGQEEEKEGLWLYASYIVQEADTAYVWAANDKNRLEKRYLTLGTYDADMDEYEIISGLEADSFIAWPMNGLYEGVAAVTDEAEVDYSSPLYNQEPESLYGTEVMYEEADFYGTEAVFEESSGYGTEAMYEEAGLKETEELK